MNTTDTQAQEALRSCHLSGQMSAQQAAAHLAAGELTTNTSEPPLDEWMAMLYAPTDGTEIELLLHHPNRRYAEGDAKREWEQVVRATWIDFNGGGWTWHGMSGTPMGWRPLGVKETP
jgi:hypothetical protein